MYMHAAQPRRLSAKTLKMDNLFSSTQVLSKEANKSKIPTYIDENHAAGVKDITYIEGHSYGPIEVVRNWIG